MNEVPDNEKVAGEAELLEDAQFVIKTFLQLRRALAVAAAESLAAKFAQISLTGFALGRMKNRKARFAELHGHIAPLGNAGGIRQSVRMIREDFRHFCRGLQIKLGKITQPPLVGHVGPRADADHHVVRLVVRALEKVHIIGRRQSEPHIARPADKLRVGLALRIHPVVVDLDEKVLLPENISVLPGQIAPAFRIPLE